jgi:hypothetical protein
MSYHIRFTVRRKTSSQKELYPWAKEVLGLLQVLRSHLGRDGRRCYLTEHGVDRLHGMKRTAARQTSLGAVSRDASVGVKVERMSA